MKCLARGRVIVEELMAHGTVEVILAVAERAGPERGLALVGGEILPAPGALRQIVVAVAPVGTQEEAHAIDTAALRPHDSAVADAGKVGERRPERRELLCGQFAAPLRAGDARPGRQKFLRLFELRSGVTDMADVLRELPRHGCELRQLIGELLPVGQHIGQAEYLGKGVVAAVAVGHIAAAHDGAHGLLLHPTYRIGRGGVLVAEGDERGAGRDVLQAADRHSQGRQRRTVGGAEGVLLVGGIEGEAAGDGTGSIARDVGIVLLGIDGVGGLADDLHLETAAILHDGPLVETPRADGGVGQDHVGLAAVGHIVGQNVAVGEAGVVGEKDAHTAVGAVDLGTGRPPHAPSAADGAVELIALGLEGCDPERFALHDVQADAAGVVARMVPHGGEEGVVAYPRVGRERGDEHIALHVHGVDIDGLEANDAVAALAIGGA